VGLSFTKMQGAGNDFVVLDGRTAPADLPALARALCDRRTGVGADGLLLALPGDAAPVRMRMFNPDGTEDDCGNGLRCLARYAVRQGLAAAPAFAVETLTGRKAVELHADGSVTVDLGRADLSPGRIPTRLPDPPLDVPLDVGGETVTVCSLFTGSAHTVLFETPDEARFRRLSPLIERHAAFPERTSVLWAEVVSPEAVCARIWERGVGETLACGTGAAAVAAAGRLTGRTGPRVAVASRGGVLHVEVADDLTLRKRGPAEFVFEGVWEAV